MRTHVHARKLRGQQEIHTTHCGLDIELAVSSGKAKRIEGGGVAFLVTDVGEARMRKSQRAVKVIGSHQPVTVTCTACRTALHKNYLEYERLLGVMNIQLGYKGDHD